MKSEMQIYLSYSILLVILTCIPLVLTAHFSLFSQDHKISRQIIEHSLPKSKILCSSYCAREPNCSAVSYEKDTGNCTLTDLCLKFYITDDFSHSGWIVMEKVVEGICPGYTIVNSMGGDGGNAFSDYYYYNSATNKKITAIELSCMVIEDVPYIRVQYGGNWAPARGGSTRGGDVRTYVMDPDEFIVAVFGALTHRIGSLQINTNKRSLPQCSASNSLKMLSYGNKLLYIKGRVGWLLDRIDFIWE